MSTASSKASGSRSAAISASALSRSWWLRLRCTQVSRKRRRSSLVWSCWIIALARRQLFGVDAGAGERRPRVLLGVVEVLDRDPPQLALEHREAALGVGRDGDDAALDAHPAPAAAAHGPTTIAPPR